jgi:hypothetical protein
VGPKQIARQELVQIESAKDPKRLALLLFAGFACFYLSLSPGTIAGMGYTSEEMASADRMLTRADAWVKGVPVPPMLWSRHGPLPVLFDVPFVALGKFFLSPDFLLSFQPVLLTAALLAVLFLWLRTLASPGMSLFLTFAGAFGTMLWPYAYIGLETKQSLFVLLCGYLSMACGAQRKRWQVMLLALSFALALSIKSTGLMLAPALGYAVWVQFRDDWRNRRADLLTVMAIAGCFWVFSAWGREQFWQGRGLKALLFWLVDSPIVAFTNAIGIFGSPTKGLFVYAPILLVCLYAVPRAWRTHRDLTVFAMLVLAGIAAEMSLLRVFADELWGSRYLHVAIAPLLLCIGAARQRWHWRKDAPMAALAAAGLVVSFLGAFYYYGVRLQAAAQVGQNTAEGLMGDGVWNQVAFHGRLFRVWMTPGKEPALWTTRHEWMYTAPPGTGPWKSVDLRALCEPQSLMLRLWAGPKDSRAWRLFGFYLSALVCGLFFLGWAVTVVFRQDAVQAAAP